MGNKHAYLIMAHNEFDILKKLLALLDNPRNDIYVHIDRKVKNFDFDYYNKLIEKSKIEFIERIEVEWGQFSQIECELSLLKNAVKNEYSYYHLISGVDLPLKTQDEIHNFFDENQGLEFVHFCEEREIYTYNVKNRIPKYNLWESNIKLRYGANWFSITHDLAKYVIFKEDWIRKYFIGSICGDELFLQTLVYDSKFENNLYVKEMNGDYRGCVRYIDWARGNPYVFRKNDYEDLINSDKFFARKFSLKIDNEIIDTIFNHLISKNINNINNKY